MCGGAGRVASAWRARTLRSRPSAAWFTQDVTPIRIEPVRGVPRPGIDTRAESTRCGVRNWRPTPFSAAPTGGQRLANPSTTSHDRWACNTTFCLSRRRRPRGDAALPTRSGTSPSGLRVVGLARPAVGGVGERWSAGETGAPGDRGPPHRHVMQETFDRLVDPGSFE